MIRLPFPNFWVSRRKGGRPQIMSRIIDELLQKTMETLLITIQCVSSFTPYFCSQLKSLRLTAITTFGDRRHWVCSNKIEPRGLHKGQREDRFSAIV
ncbi:hypothetical protein TNIN_16571 [Trichonephila inaurata madagascariensis]|uniref:Uncharacterized protein n=1 Tax=Trichonephila inaurata madagascariensis TaxID=2747483 RepID=A0A8X6IWH8_9ARAC|nr:hypothetical protein TNIN_278701 [Trichonephila inaurata madagascariensis]GFY76825.1 hypothetical protein TNIN_16571 [Trichonephila inaurata madagascariensis]